MLIGDRTRHPQVVQSCSSDEFKFAGLACVAVAAIVPDGLKSFHHLARLKGWARRQGRVHSIFRAYPPAWPVAHVD